MLTKKQIEADLPQAVLFASIIIYNPNNNTKLIIKPIRPEASTKEKPMKEKRNNSSR